LAAALLVLLVIQTAIKVLAHLCLVLAYLLAQRAAVLVAVVLVRKAAWRADQAVELVLHLTAATPQEQA
jgi:hypothetical protein